MKISAVLFLFLSLVANAGTLSSNNSSQKLTVSGYVSGTGGAVNDTATAVVTISANDGTNNCNVYTESLSGISIVNGDFSLTLHAGTLPGSLTSLAPVLDPNNTAIPYVGTCSGTINGTTASWQVNITNLVGSSSTTYIGSTALVIPMTSVPTAQVSQSTLAIGGSAAAEMSSGATLAPASVNQLLMWNGSAWQPGTITGSGGVTVSTAAAGSLIITGSGSGTVTSASVVSANGFTGTVATASTTPAITMGTSVTGLLKGNGTSVSAAVAGTDYMAGGTLSIANGGTGQTTATAAINALLPSQSGNTGMYLTTNGTSASWATAGGSVTSTSVVSANGFTGSVATSTTTPAITLATTITGLLKGSGGALIAASASDLTTLLGYTPVNKAGDTMTGALTTPSVNVNGSSLPSNGIYTPATGGVGVSVGTTNVATFLSNNNLSLGQYALASITTGSSNVAIGNQALNLTTTGSDNYALGTDTLFANTSGSHNFAVNTSTLYQNTGSNNQAIGYESQSNMSSSYNTSAGYLAMQGTGTVSNNTGMYNVAFGPSAMQLLSGGTYNVAIGSSAMQGSTAVASAATGNVAVGQNAMVNLSTGANNIAMGYYAMGGGGPVTGSNNVGVGGAALDSITSGINNVGMGPNAGGGITTGSYNVALGSMGSYPNNTGSYNIAIGYNSYSASNGLTNTIAMGATVQPSVSNVTAIGNSSVTTVLLNGASGTAAMVVGTNSSNGAGASLTSAGIWTSASDRRIKTDIRDIKYGLDDLLQLRPVSYEMVGTGEEQIGFIAQEVYQVIPEVVVKPKDEATQHWTMSYGNLVALAVAGIQKMYTLMNDKFSSQDQQIQILQKQIDALQAEVHALQQQSRTPAASAN